SGKSCLHAMCTGARLRVQNCVMVSGTEALRLESRAEPPLRLNAQIVLEHNTVAARRAAIHLLDVVHWSSPVEPIAVQAAANSFLSPFEDAARRSGLLLYEGEGLPHGLMIWQGEANGYDKQLDYYVASAHDAKAGSPQAYDVWTRLWGPLADRRPLLTELSSASLLDLDHPQLERLALPHAVRSKI